MFIHAESMGTQLDDEMNIYKRIEAGPKSHPGYGAVRSRLDSFNMEGPDGKHRCLVHPPLFESILTFLSRNPHWEVTGPYRGLCSETSLLSPGLSTHRVPGHSYR